ncbi:MAG: N-acetylmuramoyl-L-alanine amidase [Humibacillus sp.]|nr:N-acetylmuramoyl-L-alanine amidase [Humibacillus sp.]MDN5776542.1 N-acetylmuramoyl-L-alanine amidase [Humibacillus sp.]
MRTVTSALSTLVIASALVITPTNGADAVSPPTTSSAGNAGAHPIASTIVDVPVPRLSMGRGGATLSSGGHPVGAALTRSHVEFDVAGVTFTGPAVTGMKVEARTHTASRWSPWNELEVDDDGPDPGSVEGRRGKPGTAPLVAAGSDGIDLRVSSPSGAVPTGLTVSLVDGGTSPADGMLPLPSDAAKGGRDEPADSAGISGQTAASVGTPTIVSRAAWGADERLRNCTPDTLAGFKAAVVHHTVNSNSYSSSQAASLMRGIYAYHTQSREWCDVGYNFLVDRFGRIYEGRRGSITSFIQGAQAGGFNVETFGVSVIGDFTSTSFPSAVTGALSRVIAWQADRSAFDPATSVTLTSAGSTRYDAGVRVTKPRVMGHRDLSLTSCPGNTAYPQVASIRASAASQWKAGQYVQPAARFTAVTARRVLDTRRGTGAPKAALGPNRSLVLTVPGLPSNTTAVTLNVTATKATASTSVAAYPTTQARRNVSMLNVTPGRTAAAQVTVGVSPGNTLRLYNRAGSIALIADLEGYFTTSSVAGFTPITPRRVLDTRYGIGARKGKVKGGGAVTLTVPGLPSTATSVALNVTATGVTGSTVVAAYPGGRTRPNASVLNPARGDTVANLVTMPVGPGGTVNLHTSSSDIDLVADLTGYYATGTGYRFVALSPRRVLDTRSGFYSPWRPVAGHTSISLPVAGIPTTAKGVALTLTATGITGSGPLLAYPSGVSRPTASTLNAMVGRTVANFVTTGVGSGGSVTLYNGASTLHLVSDLTGYFIP